MAETRRGANGRYPLFVRGDVDGFFGLLVDNLVQVLVIIALCTAVAGIPPEFILSRILPGVALSVLAGNLYYSWLAVRVARRLGRDDLTALPYGINTPSVFAYILFIMGPIYGAYRGELGEEAAARLAWQAGMIACVGSGLIELGGAFIAGWIRKVTPRAALLGSLAGIAIGFISMDFTLQAFERPLLALLPVGIILTQYYSGVRLPLGLPAGLVALVTGAAAAWGLKAFSMTGAYGALGDGAQAEIAFEIARLPGAEAIRAALSPALRLPLPAVAEIIDGFRRTEVLAFLPIIFPMGLFNLAGSLQNIESAEAEGDPYPTMPALAANGVGSLLAACFGSCFPTTIYIGHAGWKRLGARTGYSALSGMTIALLCWGGLVGIFSLLIPQESIVGILIWIAVIIGAQAFQAIPRRHAPAVVLALFPSLAAWGLLTYTRGVMAGGATVAGLGLAGQDPVAHVGGMLALDHGFILTSMGWGALGVCLIDRKFRAAAAWTAVMAALSFFGVIHAWHVGDLGLPIHLGIGTGWRYALPYALLTALLWLLAPRAEAMPETAQDHT